MPNAKSIVIFFMLNYTFFVSSQSTHASYHNAIDL